jgi:hypothetical protein
MQRRFRYQEKIFRRAAICGFTIYRRAIKRIIIAALQEVNKKANKKSANFEKFSKFAL